MERFEALLQPCRGAVERYVKFRLPAHADAEDVLQEVWLTAYQKLDQLRDKAAFKPWLLSIARNACNEYFRRQAKVLEVPLEEVPESKLSYGRMGVTLEDTVEDVLARLPDQEKQLLYLYYWQQMPQADIAKRLDIPLGTVKSRLHTARQKFKEQYPYHPKGEQKMKKLPEYMPKYTIEKSEKEPFSVCHQELPGMLVIPKLGEKLIFGMYDLPQNKLTGYYQMEVTGEVEVHGLRGVEIRTGYYEDGRQTEDRVIFAQLTDSFCRYLGGISTDSNGARKLVTFLDEAFLDAYGIGENNCGFAVERKMQGEILLKGESLEQVTPNIHISDIVGRYTVKMNGQTYDTVRLVFVEDGMLSEQYIDKNGRTVLWRRYNRHDWHGKDWEALLPQNDRLTVNGETYVHWYDCITDYIL